VLIPSGGPADGYHGLLTSTLPRHGSRSIDSGSLAGLGFTSGTTGAPKGVTATHRAAADSCLRLLRIIDQVASPEVAEGFLTGIPIFAAGSGFVVPALVLGMTNHVPDRFDAVRTLDLIEGGRVSFAFLTPSQLTDILDTPLEERDLTPLKMIVYGSASTPAATVAEAVRRLGPVLLQGYGMSECPPPVTILRAEDHGTREHPADTEALSSAGFPAENVRLMIEAEDGRALQAFEIGEVLVSSPAITAGYFGDPERTAQARRVIGASADVASYGADGRLHVSDRPPCDPLHGWWRSGDMGFLDGAGRLHVLERKQDILHRDGRALYPRVIEEAVAEHPSVKEVCVVHLPGTEIIVAAVSLKARFRGKTPPDVFARELLAFLSSRLLPDERPDEVRVFPELPRSVQGKVLKREVRNALASRGA
jgi:acyl-CoA synthetase (AMP-forming)/AMP-acid ligase II